MRNKIKISIDLEGPLGMYPYINSKKSIRQYSRLNECIEFLFNLHKEKKKEITVGILGLTALSNISDLMLLISSIEFDYPKNSLINRLRTDSSFFKLIIENNKYFLKGEMLDKLDIKKHKYVKLACHSLSHIHIFEEKYDKEILDLEIKESFKILKKFLDNNEKIDLYISPRNQLNKTLIEILEKHQIEKIRKSSDIKLYSENHKENLILRYFFKLIRKYDRYNLPFNGRFNRSIKNKFLVEDSKYIDSGYFLEFPRYSFLYKRYLSSFKKYLDTQISNGDNINLWFHPHNMLLNINLSKKYYKEIIKILESLDSRNYFFSFL